MKKYLFLSLAPLITIIYSCKNDDKKNTAPESNIDAARNFIRAALDGKFIEARRFMLSDTVNTNYMDVVERTYDKTDSDTKIGYRTASINIHQVTEIFKDSVTIVIYSNSFKNNPDTLRLLKIKDQWLVDLKYLYEHGSDSLQHTIHLNDSLP